MFSQTFAPLRTAVFCLFSMVGFVSSAEDWPRWMGANMDGLWAEQGTINKFPSDGPRFVWKQPIGGGYAGPSVIGDRVYVMDRVDDEGRGIDVENAIRASGDVSGRERVQCLDASSGEVVWSHSYESSYNIAYPTGPRCTPAVTDQHAYTLGAMGQLICFDRHSGKIVWQRDFATDYAAKPPIWGYSSHPLVDGDKLLVPVGGEGSGVIAFNRFTGQERWRAVTTMDVAYSPLVIHEDQSGVNKGRQLIFWHAEGVTSLNPDTGQEYWNVRFPMQPNASQTSIATPRMVGSQIFISEYYKGSLLLDVEFDPPSVKELWRNQDFDPRNKASLNAMMATPAIRDGHAYGVGYDSRGRGILRCIELESGQQKWSKDDWMGAEPLPFASAFMIGNEDKHFLFNDIGELVIAKLTPEGYSELDRAKLLDPTSKARGRIVVWSHPAFANGCIIARNDKEIVCVDLRESTAGG